MAQVPTAAADILDAIKGFSDPETGRDIVQQSQIADVVVDRDRVQLTLKLTTHSAPVRSDVIERLQEKLRIAFPGLTEIKIKSGEHHRPPEKLGQIGLTAKSVIAVASGKGGVGKSTIAAVLACGLHRAGCAVGLIDADVYGPSIPHLLGVSGRPEIVDQQIQPADLDGLKVMSMGLLVPPDEAVVWRGPMLHGAIMQMLRDTAWGHLDYMIIDMPPGTGDIALSLSQMLPLTGAVVVCTPQDVALLDAVKAIAMFRKVNIPVLGMVENMSGFVCPDCEKRHDIFGSGGARKKAEELQVPFLGEVPINVPIRKYGDAGDMDAVFADPVSGPELESLVYRLCRNLANERSAAPAMPTLPTL